MHYGMISSCILGISTALLLGACSAEVDAPSSAPQRGGFTGATEIAAAAATATTSPNYIACFDVACTSKEECVSLCHEASSQCIDRHCYVP